MTNLLLNDKDQWRKSNKSNMAQLINLWRKAILPRCRIGILSEKYRTTNYTKS